MMLFDLYRGKEAEGIYIYLAHTSSTHNNE